jgi:hypothetical protein
LEYTERAKIIFGEGRGIRFFLLIVNPWGCYIVADGRMEKRDYPLRKNCDWPRQLLRMAGPVITEKERRGSIDRRPQPNIYIVGPRE